MKILQAPLPSGIQSGKMSGNWKLIFHITDDQTNKLGTKKAAKMPSPFSMEPMLPEDYRHDLEDLATDLVASRTPWRGGCIRPSAPGSAILSAR